MNARTPKETELISQALKLSADDFRLSRKASDALDSIEARTALKLTALAVLRGVDGTVSWDETRKVYLVDGQFCGPSVHNVMAWMTSKIAVQP